MLPLRRLVEWFDDRWLTHLNAFLAINLVTSLPFQRLQAKRLMLDIILQSIHVTELVFDNSAELIGGLLEVELLLEKSLERCEELEYAARQHETANL